MSENGVGNNFPVFFLGLQRKEIVITALGTRCFTVVVIKDNILCIRLVFMYRTRAGSSTDLSAGSFSRRSALWRPQSDVCAARRQVD